MEPDELEPTQGEPEGETVVNPGDETPAPEQEDTGDIEQTEVDEPDAPEQPEKAIEKPAEPEKPIEKKKPSWELRRISEETNKRREAEKRAAELDAELKRLRESAAKTAETPEEPGKVDIEAIRAQERDRIRLEEAGRLETERFNAACNQTYERGVSAFGTDFEHATAALGQALGDEIQKRPEFLQAITELDNGHQVYYELSRNPEEAERVLRLSPVKMALEIAKMSANVSKPAAKPISKAPAPVSPVGGTPKSSHRLEDEDVPMDQFADMLLKKLANKQQ